MSDLNRFLLDGVEIDGETGDIFGEVPGGDKLRWATFGLADVTEQMKLLEQIKAFYAAVIKRYQPTKSAEYTGAREGTLVATIMEQRNIVQDVNAIKHWIADTELTREDLLQLVLSSTAGNWRAAWDLKSLPEHLRDVVEDHSYERTGEPFVRTSIKRKAPPKLERKDTLLADLEASVEALS